MKIQQINSVLQPRLSRPTEWKQSAVDAVTIGVGSAAGAWLGPIVGASAGGAGGSLAESMIAGDFLMQNRTQLLTRQAMVGMAAGLASSGLQMALGVVHPALGLAVGVAVGSAAAALLPQRGQTPLQGHWANLETTQAPELWKRGLTGQGVGVAVLDTGADAHPSLEGHIATFHNFVDNDQQPHDSHHHGTAMSGIISGLGKDRDYPAVAPNSHLIILKVADAAGKVQVNKVAEAIRWASENKQRYNIGVINMSFTADAGDDAAELAEIDKAVDEATANGLIVVASAGNDGPNPALMQSPADAATAVAVASQDCHASIDPGQHNVSDFSHRCLPGSQPTVTAPGSGWLHPATGGSYLVESGTSQAAAAVSGVMALWKQAIPELTAEQARSAIAHTAVSLRESPQAQGAGSLRAQAGLDYLLKNPAVPG